jgi:hypothetical protein
MMFQVFINFGFLKRHPVQDWHTDNVADEDQRRVQIETERWGREQWARVGKTWDA